VGPALSPSYGVVGEAPGDGDVNLCLHRAPWPGWCGTEHEDEGSAEETDSGTAVESPGQGECQCPW
jgi:hypothetical protein